MKGSLTAVWNHPQSTVVKVILEQILNVRLFLSIKMKQRHPITILFSNCLFFKHFGPFFRHMEFLLKLWVEMQHCDYFDLWGEGTKVTVASGKSHLKLNFENDFSFCSSFCVSRTTQTFWEFVWIWNWFHRSLSAANARGFLVCTHILKYL